MDKKSNEKRGQLVTTFTIGKETYYIRLSYHARLRLKERNLDLYQAIGAILSLGKERIKKYTNTNRDIFIMDNINNFSIVCCIENYTIRIITLIDKADCFVREGTDIINI